MDQEVVIIGTDGTEHVFPSGFDPKRAAEIVRGGSAKAPDPRVVALQDELDPETAFMRPRLPVVTRELDQAAEDLPWNVGTTVAGAVVPGILAKALPYAPGIVQAGVVKAAQVLSKPAVGAAIGAVGGYQQGGIPGAVAGAATGYGGSKLTNALMGEPSVDVIGRLSAASKGATGSASSTGVSTPLLDALMRGSNLDELAAIGRTSNPAAFAGQAVAQAAPKIAAAVQTPRQVLQSELAARDALSKPIDWRTMDVTPIKRPGQNIILGEESTPGLLKMLQDALLYKDKAQAEVIQRAIRQRSHITGKSQ